MKYVYLILLPLFFAITSCKNKATNTKAELLPKEATAKKDEPTITEVELTDEQIKAIAKNGGVIQVNFHPGFIDPSFDGKEKAFLEKHQGEFDALIKKGMDEWYVQDYL